MTKVNMCLVFKLVVIFIAASTTITVASEKEKDRFKIEKTFNQSNSERKDQKKLSPSKKATSDSLERRIEESRQSKEIVKRDLQIDGKSKTRYKESER